jgi:hypothetical protein
MSILRRTSLAFIVLLISAWFASAAFAGGGCSSRDCPDPTTYCATSPNSVGPGALIDWTGTPSLETNDFHLVATGCPPDQFLMFYYGAGPTQVVFGNGWRCASAGGVGVFRFYPFLTNSGGTAVMKVDYTQPPAGGGPGQWLPGDTWYCQGWYRDPAAGGAQFNLTDGLEVQVCQPPSWHHPTDYSDHIPTGHAGAAFAPAVARSANGDIVIAWRQEQEVLLSERRNGVWTHGIEICPGNSVGVGEAPEVAMDDHGNAIVVWSQPDPTGASLYEIYVSTCFNGVWTHPGDTDYISLGNSMLPEDPQVAMNGSRQAVVTWLQGNRVYASEYQFSTGSWSTPNLLDPAGFPHNRWQPKVAMDEAGDIVITWAYDPLGSHSRVYVAEKRSGVWQYPGLSDYFNLPCPQGELNGLYADVAMNEQGNTIVVWAQKNEPWGGKKKIYKSEYRNLGSGFSWHHPIDLDDYFGPGNEAFLHPHVAMADSDDALIVFDGVDERLYRVEYRGGSWGAETVFDAYGGWASWLWSDVIDLTMDNLGNALVVWTQTIVYGDHRVFMSEYRNGSWSDPQDVDSDFINPGTPPTLAEYTPRVAMADNGQATIVWSQKAAASSDPHVFMSYYE